MTDKKNKDEFDPEKHREIEKGPLKEEHTNQYGEKPGGKDRNLSERAAAEEKRAKK